MNRRIKILGTKPNKCCVFVLPMCEINYKSMPKNFINCYLNYERGNDNYQIVAVYTKTDEFKVSFDHFFEYISNNKNYVGIEDFEDEVVMYFNIPDRNKGNYELFLAGKYSKFSEAYKKTLIGYYGNLGNKANYEVYEHDVIMPTDFKRMQIARRLFDTKDLEKGLKWIDEVYDKPDLEVEKFKSIRQLTETNQIIKSNDNKQQNPIGNNDFQ